MCGIVAALGEPPDEAVWRAVRALAHRGPDGEGMTRYAGKAFGHRRLAIVDPEAGTQPMFNEDRSLAVVLNGEIYNHRLVRGGLSGSHRYGTHCDVEVVPHLYEERGAEGVKDLDGMYGFALGGDGDFVAARDPVGIKPLYVMKEGGVTWFASEIKALAGVGAAPIEEFPPGHRFAPATGWARFRNLEPGEIRWRDHRAASPLIRRELENAVERRLMSDVPLGAFLSGGLDSSLIAALIMRLWGGKLRTFSTGLPGSEDVARSREVAEAIGSLHTVETMSEGEIAGMLPEIVASLENYDRDLVRSAIPCYFVSRLARREVKVVLTGEGSDELFAGYSYLRAYRDAGELQAEMVRLVGGLHNMNLQRVDRMTMAHGLEGRVPFLDLKLIDLALAIDPELKLYGPGRPEKWLLRQAFEDLLPERILWREKSQFDEGSGVAALMPRLSAGRVDLAEERVAAGAAGLPPLRDAEEAWYFHLFRERYRLGQVRRTLGRWAPEGTP